MKNYLVMFLALVLLAQGMSPLTGALARLPALVAHFYLHHEHAHHDHGDELSFLDFLAQHYGNRQHHDDAGRGHSDLPFRCADASFSLLLLALPCDQLFPEGTICPTLSSRTAFGNPAFHSTIFVRDIFRPPVN